MQAPCQSAHEQKLSLVSTYKSSPFDQKMKPKRCFKSINITIIIIIIDKDKQF